MKTAHIYWFAHYNMLGPCTRYRGKYVVETLKQNFGISYNFVYPSYQFKNVLKFAFIYLEVLLNRKKNAVIVFQKTYTNGIYSFLLKILILIRSKRTVYDIDDAYYIRFPPRTINFFLKRSKICITGSDALSEYASNVSGNKNKVFTLSSPIIDHNNLKKYSNDKFTIGWVGFYNYHRSSLREILFPAIKKIDKEIKIVLLGVVKDIHFEEIRAYFKEDKNIELDLPNDIDWLDENKFYQKVKFFDVGVSPLLDTAENRAKSAFKLKQYLCCGVPVIGSDTGENSKIIQNAQNGFIANDSEAFYHKILKIMEQNQEERNRFSIEALKSVKRFEMKAYCASFLEVVESDL